MRRELPGVKVSVWMTLFSVDVPVVTGEGTVQVVVRDATGKEVVTSADYFAAQELLKPGLSDYSAEVGFARTNFGAAGFFQSPKSWSISAPRPSGSAPTALTCASLKLQ